MIKEEIKKIKRAYKIGKTEFMMLSLICNSLRKFENGFFSIINNLKYKKRKEIIKKVNDYELILNPRGKGIQKQLLINGNRELLATRALERELKEGDIVLEAGANIGYYVILEGKKLGKKGLIYAIEPSKENYLKLKRNIKHNKLKNIKTYNLAFGDREGIGNLRISNWCNMNQIVKEKERLGKIEKVKMMTIDKFLKNKKKPNVVRMDVEGYEYEIFKGMEKLLKINPPRLLYIETHFKAMGKKRAIKFLTNLKNYGYEIKYCFLYETATSKIPLLNYLDKKRLKLVNKKITINDLIRRGYDIKYPASLEIFFEHKKLKNKNLK